jgi:hypothetical protein
VSEREIHGFLQPPGVFLAALEQPIIEAGIETWPPMTYPMIGEKRKAVSSPQSFQGLNRRTICLSVCVRDRTAGKRTKLPSKFKGLGYPVLSS